MGLSAHKNWWYRTLPQVSKLNVSKPPCPYRAFSSGALLLYPHPLLHTSPALREAIWQTHDGSRSNKHGYPAPLTSILRTFGGSSRKWHGYFWEGIGIHHTHTAHAFGNESIASISTHTDWHRHSLQTNDDKVWMIRRINSERSLRTIAEAALGKKLERYRDYVKAGLDLISNASNHHDVVLGYSLVGLAISKCPVTSPCQYHFCFRDTPTLGNGRHAKYCDEHASGTDRYVKARYLSKRLEEGNEKNPNQNLWLFKDWVNDYEACDSPLSKESRDDLLSFIQSFDQMYQDRGLPIEALQLGSKIETAILRLYKERDHERYGSIGLAAQQPKKDWRAVVQSWARMYPWLHSSVLTSESWPGTVGALRRVLNDKHCASNSSSLWDAKLACLCWEREMTGTYDRRLNPDIPKKIELLAKGNLNQKEIAARLNVSRARVSQCVKDNPGLHHLRRKTMRKFCVNIESN